MCASLFISLKVMITCILKRNQKDITSKTEKGIQNYFNFTNIHED